MKVVFVGQGPNRTAYEKGIEIGTRIMHRKMTHGWTPAPGEFITEVFSLCQKYCARVALTGSVGAKLGALLDIPVGVFFRRYERRNLNASYNGKAGKGDKFNVDEARFRAGEIDAEPFTHYVLLGAQVAAAFKLKGEPLELRLDRDTRKSYLLFPHPSGINAWWNEDFNRFRARKRLREFLNVTTE